MKITRKANAIWQGTGKDGKGNLSTASTTLKNSQYSYKTRFEEGVGTNPEELIGAAHAGCFAMQLSFLLAEEGFDSEQLDTEAKVILEDGTITEVHLELKGKVTGIEEDKFKSIANKAKEICPVSKLFKADIKLNATLV